MGKVHDKSQGKLKKGMRVALITSITTLALVGAAFGGFKLYDRRRQRVPVYGQRVPPGF